jgi:hypothetical protein
MGVDVVWWREMSYRTYEIVTGIYQWLLFIIGIPSTVVILDMWSDVITPHERDALSYMLLDVAYWGVGVTAVIGLLYYLTYRYYKHHN